MNPLKKYNSVFGSLLFLFSLLIISTTFSLGGDFYVATTGNDTTGNGSQMNPWRTIAHAISAANPSSNDPATIHVAAGTYSLSLTGEKYPLKLISYLVLKGEADSLTILDATSSFSSPQRVIECDSVTHVSIEGFTIKRGRAPTKDYSNNGGGILIQYSSYITVAHNIISNNAASNNMGGGAYGGGIAIYSSPYTLVTDNTIQLNSAGADGSGGGGIYIHSSYGIISFNNINRNHVAGIPGGPGAGIVVSGNNIHMISNKVNRNYESALGGGLSVSGTPLIMRNTIDSNSAWWGGAGMIVFSTGTGAIIGGSEKNGNNFYDNTTDDAAYSSGKQLYQYYSYPHINAEYNYFGIGVNPHDPKEVDGNFDVDPYCTSPIIFDTLGIIAVPSPLKFDTVLVDSPKSIAVALFNVANSLTDSIVIFATQLHDRRTLLKLSSSLIRPIEVETLLVTINPVAAGEYNDTLTLSTNVGSLVIPIRAVVMEPVNVEDNRSSFQPLIFALHQNYPNPFNPVTDVKYQIAERSYVLLRIYDVLGREIATLVDEVQDAGYKSVKWEAVNVPSGVYFYRLQTGNFVDVKKMILMR